MMKTKSIIEKIMYLITFTGIIIANVSTILFDVTATSPIFLAGVLIALFGVNGVLLLKHPTFQIHYRSANSSWTHYVE